VSPPSGGLFVKSISTHLCYFFGMDVAHLHNRFLYWLMQFCIGVLTVCALATNVTAQTDTQSQTQSLPQSSSDRDKAIAMAHKIANYRSKDEYEQSPRGRRQEIMDFLSTRAAIDENSLLASFERDFANTNQFNHKFIPIFRAGFTLQQMDTEEFEKSDTLKKLLAFTKSKDWQIANRANIILGLESLFRGDTARGVKFAQNAVDLIPSTVHDTFTKEARYETLDLLQLVFAFEVNLPDTVRFGNEFIELGIDTNRRLDTITILHNLVDVFYETEDYETAKEISLIMSTIDFSDEAFKNLLVKYDLGRSYLALGDFEQANTIFTEALSLDPPETLDIAISSYLAYSLAESGRISDSAGMVTRAINLINNSTLYKIENLPHLLKAQAILHQNNGQHQEAFEELTHWADTVVKRKSAALTKSRVDSANRLATTQELKNEKIDRLLEKTRLDAEILKRSYYIAGLLFVVLLLTLIGLGVMLVNRQKMLKLNAELEKTNADLLVSRDDALVAEKAKSQFLAVMSHELRTPLNGILAMTDMISETTQEPHTKNAINIVQESSQRLFSLIKNVLVAAEINNDFIGRVISGNLYNSCSRILRKLEVEARKKGLKFSSLAHKNMNGMYEYNEETLDLILYNLISNAIKFTDEGEIKVVFIAKTDGQGNTLLTIQIKDTGMGMDKEILDKVGDVFYQEDSTFKRKYEGAGLGIHVSRKLLKNLGGDLSISSVDGSGTLVVITMPVKIDNAEDIHPSLISAA
jgi:signal transduction histidine kinase